MLSRLFSTYLVLVGVLIVCGCERVVERSEPLPDAAATPPIAQLPFGNPSNASPDDTDDLLLIRDHYAMSYNAGRGTMNWVAWFTRRADLGERLERPLFEPDPMLPSGVRRIQYYDYSGSGYDRGHMIPSADRFGDRRKNAETFLMTNIVPQTPSLNQYTWNELEQYARKLVHRGDTTYTIAGVYGEKDRLKGRVTAPEYVWKVIVVFPQGREQITRSTRVIAVDMPNVDTRNDKVWQRYATTVRRIEERAGVDLFRSLPRDIQDAIENKVDTDKPSF